MSIYTKTGDDGSTGLFYGGRVAKDSAGPEAYGSVDEAVSALGVARAEAVASGAEIAEELLRVQRELFVVAAELATLPENRFKLVDGRSRPTPEMVSVLESRLDELIAVHGAPTRFVVPGNNRLAAALDLARTVTRRAERMAVAALGVGDSESQVIPYLNRLADYLYMLARAAEEDWTPSRVEDKT